MSVGGVGEDSTGLSLTFSKFGYSPLISGTSPANGRKFCKVQVRFDYPEGWSYTVAKAVVKGYVNVPKQCSAQFKTLVNPPVRMPVPEIFDQIEYGSNGDLVGSRPSQVRRTCRQVLQRGCRY